MSNVVPLNIQASRYGKSEAIDRTVGLFIAKNQSIIIGTAYPRLRLKELQEKFPEATFEICGLGVRLCVKE